jgi:hypothetical protein
VSGWQKTQVNISRLGEQIKYERDQFEKAQAENAREQHERQTRAAIRIQSIFRGFRFVVEADDRKIRLLLHSVCILCVTTCLLVCCIGNTVENTGLFS